MKNKITIVAATSNAHKVQEMRNILGDAYNLITASEVGFYDDVAETGSTFLENAILKAHAVCRATGLPALADDSGLCVDALNGAPGIYSARYSGQGNLANRQLLLKNMAKQTNRAAHYECAIVLTFPDGREYQAVGKTTGSILYEEQGSNGFSYDCIFFSDDLQKSFAVATEEEKNAVSHRGRALQQIVMALKKINKI